MLLANVPGDFPVSRGHIPVEGDNIYGHNDIILPIIGWRPSEIEEPIAAQAAKKESDQKQKVDNCLEYYIL
jgi:hypothetical protein